MSATDTSPLAVRVLLFARYADLLGRETVALELRPPAVVADAVAALRRLDGGAALPARPLCALNLRQVDPDAALADGDELALLPPLAGG